MAIGIILGALAVGAVAGLIGGYLIQKPGDQIVYVESGEGDLFAGAGGDLLTWLPIIAVIGVIIVIIWYMFIRKKA